MEDLEMKHLYNGIYKDKRVLLTGHTGFKGSWLLLWLQQMGALVKGYALPPATDPAHILLLDQYDPSSSGDIRDLPRLTQAMQDFQPDIVFHLAAQPLVRRSYADPLETFHSNVIGTANVLEAIRKTPTVKAVINITTDKVYHNHEWPWAYRETDGLGGHDPYSTSKACAELIHESYRKSFFMEAGIRSATARAGNVIGGGDWAGDRLIPDVVRAAIRSLPTDIRNPGSVRPWQHVLDPLSGYLLLGQLLLEGNEKAEGSWNFGPDGKDCLSVTEVFREFGTHWPEVRMNDASNGKHPHEAGVLRLDCAKAMAQLAWTPVWNIQSAIARTAQWYKNYYQRHTVGSLQDLEQYIRDAEAAKMNWTR
jgi:CDP-glucose 4,6-dehydratase